MSKQRKLQWTCAFEMLPNISNLNKNNTLHVLTRDHYCKYFFNYTPLQNLCTLVQNQKHRQPFKFIFVCHLLSFLQYYETVTRGFKITKWYTERYTDPCHYLQFLFSLSAVTMSKAETKKRKKKKRRQRNMKQFQTFVLCSQ